MSKRKPKPEPQPRAVIVGPSRAEREWINERMREAGMSALPLEDYHLLRDMYRAVPCGPRSVPANCARPVVHSIRKVAALLLVDAKSDRFVSRFIASGILAADQLSPQRWRFDADELERVREQVLRGTL